MAIRADLICLLTGKANAATPDQMRLKFGRERTRPTKKAGADKTAPKVEPEVRKVSSWGRQAWASRLGGTEGMSHNIITPEEAKMLEKMSTADAAAWRRKKAAEKRTG